MTLEIANSLTYLAILIDLCHKIQMFVKLYMCTLFLFYGDNCRRWHSLNLQTSCDTSHTSPLSEDMQTLKERIKSNAINPLNPFWVNTL